MMAVCPTGRVFIYPCSGKDVVAPILAFGAHVDIFIFVDINYQFNKFKAPSPSGWSELTDSVTIEGPPVEDIKYVVNDKHKYREVVPAWRRSKYSHAGSGRQIDVIFRRGFGQYALHELNDESLGIFFHRGDSSIEGGSGVYYLRNKRMSHKPISRLMDVIKRKLIYPAYIVSDGSNTKICQLIAAGNGDQSLSNFNSHGLSWERTVDLPSRTGDSRRSVVWRVNKQSD